MQQHLKTSAAIFAIFIASLIGLFITEGKAQDLLFLQFIVSAALYITTSILITRKA